MEDFLENLFRLFRFFISSLIGLLMTIINPYLLFFKKKQLAYILY